MVWFQGRGSSAAGRDGVEGLAPVRAFLQPTYLNSDELGVGVFGMKVNVFGMSDVGSGKNHRDVSTAQVPLISSAWQLLLAKAHSI